MRRPTSLQIVLPFLQHRPLSSLSHVSKSLPPKLDAFLQLKRQIKYRLRQKAELPVNRSNRPAINVSRRNPHVCTGCGISLQNIDFSKPGYIYKGKRPTENEGKLWHIEKQNCLFD